MYPTQVFVCLWKGCKVYNTPSTSQSWLQRHMLTHSGDKPFKVNTHARTHNSPVSHESEYLLTTWTTCNSVSLKSLCIMWVDCEWCVFLQCVVGGCNATFASQGGLARHVPTHFSSQSSSKVSNQGKVKEESPSKAGLNKRRKLKNKQRRSLRMYKLTHTSLSG